MTLYFAYGSNLNKGQMSRRCPAAKPLCGYVLEDWRLVFRGVADIEPAPGQNVQGGIWEITDTCEAALDRYEGISPGKTVGMYYKHYIPVEVTRNGSRVVEDMLVYLMTDTERLRMPGRSYYESIVDGFRDFGLDESALPYALKLSACVEPERRPARDKARAEEHNAKVAAAKSRERAPQPEDWEKGAWETYKGRTTIGRPLTRPEPWDAPRQSQAHGLTNGQRAQIEAEDAMFEAHGAGRAHKRRHG